MHQKGAGLVPGSGTCLGCYSVPVRVCTEATDGRFSLTSMFLAPPLSLKDVSSGEDLKSVSPRLALALNCVFLPCRLGVLRVWVPRDQDFVSGVRLAWLAFWLVFTFR